MHLNWLTLINGGRYGLMVQTGPMAELSTAETLIGRGRSIYKDLGEGTKKRMPSIGLFAGLRCISFLAVLYLFFWIDHWT